jgi:hypothetical protein
MLSWPVVGRICDERTKPLVFHSIAESVRHAPDKIINGFDSSQVIWLYRNPVNVFFSGCKMWGTRYPQQWTISEPNVRRFCKDYYNDRNQKVAQCYDNYKDKIFIVKYEDLIESRELFDKVCDFADAAGEYIWREDSNLGYKELDSKFVKLIRKSTEDTFDWLEKHRSEV